MTGTGSALLLDGHDGGMVRASVLDGQGNVAHMANNNVSFRVLSGPGHIIGAHNGDVSSHEPNHAPWRSAYHGLVRVVLQVSKDCTTPKTQRARILEIDGDASQGLVAAPEDPCVPEPIVLEASAPGMESVKIDIPTSIDASRDSVFYAAEASAGQPVTIN